VKLCPSKLEHRPKRLGVQKEKCPKGHFFNMERSSTVLSAWCVAPAEHRKEVAKRLVLPFSNF